MLVDVANGVSDGYDVVSPGEIVVLVDNIKYELSKYSWYRRWRGGKWYLVKSHADDNGQRAVTGVWSQIDLSQIAEQVGEGSTFRKVAVVAAVEDYTHEEL